MLNKSVPETVLASFLLTIELLCLSLVNRHCNFKYLPLYRQHIFPNSSSLTKESKVTNVGMRSIPLRWDDLPLTTTSISFSCEDDNFVATELMRDKLKSLYLYRNNLLSGIEQIALLSNLQHLEIRRDSINVIKAHIRLPTNLKTLVISKADIKISNLDCLICLEELHLDITLNDDILKVLPTTLKVLSFDVSNLHHFILPSEMYLIRLKMKGMYHGNLVQDMFPSSLKFLEIFISNDKPLPDGLLPCKLEHLVLQGWRDSNGQARPFPKKFFPPSLQIVYFGICNQLFLVDILPPSLRCVDGVQTFDSINIKPFTNLTYLTLVGVRSSPYKTDYSLTNCLYLLSNLKQLYWLHLITNAFEIVLPSSLTLFSCLNSFDDIAANLPLSVKSLQVSDEDFHTHLPANLEKLVFVESPKTCYNFMKPDSSLFEHCTNLDSLVFSLRFKGFGPHIKSLPQSLQLLNVGQSVNLPQVLPSRLMTLKMSESLFQRDGHKLNFGHVRYIRKTKTRLLHFF